MKVIHFNPKQGWPVSENLWYRCQLCNDVIPSKPSDCKSCRCGNISIDIDYARISVKQENNVELLESAAEKGRHTILDTF
jgi:hypothetical protein